MEYLKRNNNILVLLFSLFVGFITVLVYFKVSQNIYISLFLGILFCIGNYVYWSWSIKKGGDYDQ
ncbi:hypothetical protein QI033_12930 [Staphylococcus saprophyticus]|nr:hypothetical protein [Staphylococcus saprophyticus]